MTFQFFLRTFSGRESNKCTLNQVFFKKKKTLHMDTRVNDQTNQFGLTVTTPYCKWEIQRNNYICLEGMSKPYTIVFSVR